MENLAGRRDCDKSIERELNRCGIELVRLPSVLHSEVPASITGKLGQFQFHRAWYYWIVRGNMPLPVAQELYDDPVGKTDIRVAGHCGCPPPIEWATYIDAEGRILCPISEKPQGDSELARSILARTDIRFVKDPSSEGEGFVQSYHIDSELGLKIFADTLKRHNLI
ncbi:MAG: hypothetical protein HYT62_03085 [Candidatus Yanofskybacteria bacterium]|nr:hypothetical protein [Candidatus Yanofskybacteria bacterium]